MTDYRRNFVAGGSFFFTVNLADRRRSLLTEFIDILRTAFRETRVHHPFTTDAMVVLPDHLHAVWTLPEGDTDFSTRWRLIKASFSRRLDLGEPVSSSRAAKGERGIWQRRYWGTYHSRRRRFRAAHRLRPYQSAQAWLGEAGQGLAVFVVSSHGQAGRLSGGLGGRHGGAGRRLRRKAVIASQPVGWVERSGTHRLTVRSKQR